ncbi:AAA family ATPase [Breoghania sp.]|uniref:AAA family ATPase n=1 Tax=Breoghania sp. TaxID=2065378 RepID=UPI002AABD62A|nr:AAA family ATPase [Breoghania sp.]
MLLGEKMIELKVFAKNFRGFRRINIELASVNFIVGDNSSGKSSILHLINCIFTESFLRKYNIVGSSEKVSSSVDVLSPYIEESEVSIGFMVNGDDVGEFGGVEQIGRIVTYTASKSRKELLIDRVVSVNNEGAMLVRRKGKSLLSKKIDSKSKMFSYTSVLKEHLSPSRGYRTLSIPIKRTYITNIAWELAFLDFSSEENAVGMPYFIGRSPVRINYYGPIRMDPQNIYMKPSSERKLRGEHIPHRLYQLFENYSEKMSSVKESINQFGRESGLFDEIDVRPYKLSDPKSPIRINITKNGKVFSLDEVGYGVSQILPVIVDAILMSQEKNALLLIQQPELHLHPKAQAAFGELVFKLARAGLRLVIETHSDYVIDRYRYCLFKNEEGSELTQKILFCENRSNGNSISEVLINKKGHVDSPPDSYREFFFREQSYLFEMI